MWRHITAQSVLTGIKKNATGLIYGLQFKQKQKIIVDFYKWYLSKFIFKSCSSDVGVKVDSFVEGLDVTVGSVERRQDVLHVLRVVRQLLLA